MAIQETKNLFAKPTKCSPSAVKPSPVRPTPRRPITPPRVRRYPKPHFFPPHMRDHLPQSIPRTCPTSTNLNLGSLAVRSRVTKSTAPSASAASRAIRIRLDTRRAADLPASLLNGITNPQTLTTQDDGMAIDSSSSSNPAAQSQGTTTDAATTDAATTDAATTDVAMTDVTMTDVAMTDVVMTDVVMTDVLMTDVVMTDAAGK